MGLEQPHEAGAALEDGVVLAAPDREIPVRLLEDFDRLVADGEQPLDQVVLAADIGVVGAGAALLQEAVAGIGVEQQIGIAERDQRAQHSDPEEQPGFHVDDAERVGAQPREHLLSGVGDERAGHLAIMGERQVEHDRDRE